MRILAATLTEIHLVIGAWSKIRIARIQIGVIARLLARIVFCHGSSSKEGAQIRWGGKIVMATIAIATELTIGAEVTVATTSDGTKNGARSLTSQVGLGTRPPTKLVVLVAEGRLGLSRRSG